MAKTEGRNNPFAIGDEPEESSNGSSSGESDLDVSSEEPTESDDSVPSIAEGAEP